MEQEFRELFPVNRNGQQLREQGVCPVCGHRTLLPCLPCWLKEKMKRQAAGITTVIENGSEIQDFLFHLPEEKFDTTLTLGIHLEGACKERYEKLHAARLERNKIGEDTQITYQTDRVKNDRIRYAQKKANKPVTVKSVERKWNRYPRAPVREKPLHILLPRDIPDMDEMTVELDTLRIAPGYAERQYNGDYCFDY